MEVLCSLILWSCLCCSCHFQAESIIFMDNFIWCSKLIHIPLNLGTATKLKICEIEFCVGIGKLRKVERAPSCMSPSFLTLLFLKFSLVLASQRVTWQLYFALNKIYFSLLSSFSSFQTKEKSLEECFLFPLIFFSNPN